jgi:hypothetical protein
VGALQSSTFASVDSGREEFLGHPSGRSLTLNYPMSGVLREICGEGTSSQVLWHGQVAKVVRSSWITFPTTGEALDS